MAMNLFSTLSELFGVLSLNKHLHIQESALVQFGPNAIPTPIGDMSELLFKQKSTLEDQLVTIGSVRSFIEILTKANSIVRLNHIGFCYKVDSSVHEKDRLCRLATETSFHLYQEKSNDEGLWLFLGDTANWDHMMVELLPVESTQDQWKEYWLPHVQIDIDTTLSEQEIIGYAQEAFGDTVTPFPIAIERVVYIVRCRLGCVDGVNISLDIATNKRNVKFQRQQLLHRVD